MTLRAIDTHIHVLIGEGEPSLSEYMRTMEEHYKFKQPTPQTIEELVEDFGKKGIKYLPVAWDAETNTGFPKTSNDFIASLVKRWPDIFPAGWAAVDPWKGEMATQELERSIKELGLIGLKFQTVCQGFFPNDQRFYPLWEKCVELNIPVLLHTGFGRLGAGPPGGMGLHLKYAHPMAIDDVAADFPELTIIALHPSWPWQEEMLAVLQHKGNVYNELSGLNPRHFPPSLKQEIGGRLQDKFMFGSDYPALNPARWLNSFEREGYSPEVIEKVFWKNAKRIFGHRLPEHTWE